MERYVDNERMPDIQYYKKPLYPVWMECIKVWLMFALGLFIVFYAAYDVGEGYGFYYYVAVLCVMPVLSVAVRRKVKSLVAYLALHAVFFGWCWLSPSPVLTAMAAIYILLLTVYGMVRNMSKEVERELSMLTFYTAIGVMVVVYIISVLRNKQVYESQLLIQGLIYTLIFLYFDHRVSVMNALKAMDKQGNFSTKRIIRFNNGVFLIYMVLAVGLFWLLYYAGLSNVLGWIGRLILTIIRKIVGFLTSDEVPEVEEIEEVVQTGEEASQMGGLPAGKTSPFWEFLQHILVAVFVAFIVFALIMLVIRLFKNFHESYGYTESGYEEYKTFYTKHEAEGEKRRGLSVFDRSPENLIRRAYYKKVRKKIDKTVSRSDTPSEVAEKLPEVAELIDRYDQVRYGHMSGSGEKQTS